MVDEAGTIICLEFTTENYNIGFEVYRRIDNKTVISTLISERREEKRKS
jgi:hypothetical protein